MGETHCLIARAHMGHSCYFSIRLPGSNSFRIQSSTHESAERAICLPFMQSRQSIGFPKPSRFGRPRPELNECDGFAPWLDPESLLASRSITYSTLWGQKSLPFWRSPTAIRFDESSWTNTAISANEPVRASNLRQRSPAKRSQLNL